MKKAALSRRRFLGQASCAAVSVTPLITTLLNLQMANSAAAQAMPIHTTTFNDYRALVCVMLAGGNDSFNMVVPAGSSEYQAYARTRSNLALPQSSLLPLNGTHNGQSLGIHPGMPEVASLFNTGEIACVANVGTLVEPTTLTAYQNGGARLPVGLYSHNDQLMHWQTSVPDSRSPYGWGGRVADILSGANDNQRISMNLSVAGTNTFQAGRQTVSYEIDPRAGGAVLPIPFDEESNSSLSAIATTRARSLLDTQYKNLFQRTFARTTTSALDSGVEFAAAVNFANVQTSFSSSELSQAFSLIAKTIAARESLGVRRQIFFVMMDGYDHHGELLNNHAAMVPVVSAAMHEFNTAMKELQVHDKVTTFTVSDFARTLSSNGRGSDHGWGGNQLVMGGAVNGGLVYGTYPDLSLGNNLDTGRGVLIPTLSTDEYFAELARWFGVPDSSLTDIFPNLSRFFNVGSGAPVGFMRMS